MNKVGDKIIAACMAGCIYLSAVDEGKIKKTEEKPYYFPIEFCMPAPDHVHQSTPGIVYTMDKEFATVVTSVASPIRTAEQHLNKNELVELMREIRQLMNN